MADAMVMRRASLIGVLVAAIALPGAAQGSELIARDATKIRLRVDRTGQALVEYTVGRTRVHLLARGAINARHPSRSRPQVAFKLDYSGGWKTKRRAVWRGFRNICGRYRGPQLAWFVRGCTMPDGSHWALQRWQRMLPNYGLAPTRRRAAWELRLSHWIGPTAQLEVFPNWAYGRFDHLFGRLTYLGVAVHGFASTSRGNPLDAYGRNIYVDTLDSAYGPGWRRENSFLAHVSSGAFCYGLFAHGSRPSGKGTRYRATAIGPGVTPDVMWEGSAPGPYDRARDAELANAQRQLYGSDRLCRPV
ncbi:MAG: hypothetical protein ACKVUT_03985 [Gaiella sp.]